METIIIKPEKEQKTLWYITWAIPFVIGVALCAIPLVEAGMLVFILCLAGWSIIMMPFLFYIPAYYKSVEYTIDNDDIKMKEGVFWKTRVTIPYPKITNVDISQGPIQRSLNIGKIHIQTAGAGGAAGAQAEMALVGIRDFEGLKSTIMERFRGYSTSGVVEVPKDAEVGNKMDVLNNILKELTAIREVLERRDRGDS